MVDGGAIGNRRCLPNAWRPRGMNERAQDCGTYWCTVLAAFYRKRWNIITRDDMLDDMRIGLLLMPSHEFYFVGHHARNINFWGTRFRDSIEIGYSVARGKSSEKRETWRTPSEFDKNAWENTSAATNFQLSTLVGFDFRL
jgi:hypothetical protein